LPDFARNAIGIQDSVHGIEGEINVIKASIDGLGTSVQASVGDIEGDIIDIMTSIDGLGTDVQESVGELEVGIDDIKASIDGLGNSVQASVDDLEVGIKGSMDKLEHRFTHNLTNVLTSVDELEACIAQIQTTMIGMGSDLNEIHRLLFTMKGAKSSKMPLNNEVV
jgi:methyl-accepting chemotaxis protein